MYSKKYRNIKNQNIYEVIREDVINCTNANDGEVMVLYKSEKSPDLVFGDLNGLELERYVADPLLCRQIRLYQACENTPSAAAIRAYGEFGFLHEDILDSLMIGFSVIKMGYRAGLSFENISERTQDMLSRRKLWDFMEEIPLTEDPRKVCRKLILEALEGVRDR